VTINRLRQITERTSDEGRGQTFRNEAVYVDRLNAAKKICLDIDVAFGGVI
jgi:hypothetical protein